MTLYTDEDSVSGHVLRLLIAEKECPCDVKIVDRTNLPPLLQSINPQGRLPFLTDKMLALFDYNSIILYLQERFPASEFLPEHPKLRAQIRQVCALLTYYADIKDGITPMFDSDWRKTTIGDIDELLDPKATWLLGEEFTLADVFAAALLYKIAEEGFEDVPLGLRGYMCRLFNRISFGAKAEKVLETIAA